MRVRSKSPSRNDVKHKLAVARCQFLPHWMKLAPIPAIDTSDCWNDASSEAYIKLRKQDAVAVVDCTTQSIRRYLYRGTSYSTCGLRWRPDLTILGEGEIDASDKDRKDENILVDGIFYSRLAAVTRARGENVCACRICVSPKHEYVVLTWTSELRVKGNRRCSNPVCIFVFLLSATHILDRCFSHAIA